MPKTASLSSRAAAFHKIKSKINKTINLKKRLPDIQ